MATFEDAMLWLEWQDKLTKAKAIEMRMRKEICADIFAGETGKFKRKKTFTNPDPESEGDICLLAESKVTLSVDEEVLQQLQDEGRLSIAELACIQTKLSIKEGPLRKLPQDSPIWEAITEKPAAPTLKAVEADE